MKKKHLSIIVIAICFLLVTTLLATLGISHFPTASSLSASIQVSDQVTEPEIIIFRSGRSTIKIKKGKQFDDILKLINQRLKGTKIITNSVWADFDIDKSLSSLKTIEFDYTRVQKSSFKYVGIIHLPLNGKRPANPHTDIQYKKLVFPLTDKKDEGANIDKFSLSFFYYGDPHDGGLSVNGRDGKSVFQEYPIGSPNELVKYRKGII